MPIASERLRLLAERALKLGNLTLDFLVREFGRIVRECERQLVE